MQKQELAIENEGGNKGLEAIRLRMRETGASQRAIADQWGVDPSQVTKFFKSSKPYLPAERLPALAEATGWPVDRILQLVNPIRTNDKRLRMGISSTEMAGFKEVGALVKDILRTFEPFSDLVGREGQSGVPADWRERVASKLAAPSPDILNAWVRPLVTTPRGAVVAPLKLGGLLDGPVAPHVYLNAKGQAEQPLPPGTPPGTPPETPQPPQSEPRPEPPHRNARLSPESSERTGELSFALNEGGTQVRVTIELRPAHRASELLTGEVWQAAQDFLRSIERRINREADF